MPGHRVALVTGAARGIGRGIVDALAKDGFHIVALDRDFDGSDLADSEALALIRYDLTDIAGIAALVDSLGRIDVLINNAGVQNGLAIDAYTDAAREQILTVNLKSVLLPCKHVLPVMRSQQSGAIINVSSVAAVCFMPTVAYKTSKAGMNAYTQALALGNAKYGIRANVIMPGLMNTPMIVEPLKGVYGAGDVERMIETRDAQCPTGRMGDAWDVAEAALYLASDAARYVTAAEIVVDGGITAKFA